MKKTSKLVLSSAVFALIFSSQQIHCAQKMQDRHESAQPNEPKKTAMISAPDIRELEKWHEKFQSKYKWHRRLCFDCTKPSTVGNMHFSGDCLVAQKLTFTLERIGKERRTWGQNPSSDLYTLGEFEIQTKAKWIDGVGYDLVLKWDNEKKIYLIVKR